MNYFTIIAFVLSGVLCYCAGTYVTAMTMNSIHVQEVMDCEDEQIAVPPNAAPVDHQRGPIRAEL